MCGIAGFINLNGEPASIVTAKRMTALQRHRGPDDDGIRLFSLTSGRSAEVMPGQLTAVESYDGALGFNRLKVLDLTPCGHQPMTSANGDVIIAFNGEIYNAFDFRPELESAGYRFHSRTDTEVVLHLYEHFGLAGVLERLNGMFAFVIVDLRRREVLMVRDPFGIKPFYWTVAGSALLFGSEAKSFLAHPCFRAEVAAEHLDEFLAFRSVAGGPSLLKGVTQLPPGSYLKLKNGRLATERYGSSPECAENEDWSEARAVDEVDQALRASVESQVRCDVKVGCQLSGGIDSSLVAVFARRHLGANLPAFSVVFDDPRFSEQPWMEQAAATAGAAPHFCTFTPDLFNETLRRATWHMDQPISHPNSLGIWLLARHARPHVTVLLSGEGADEVFGGYSRFSYANRRSEATDAYINASRLQPPERLRELRPDMSLGAAMAKRRDIYEQGQGSPLDRRLAYERQTHLVDLLVRQDKMTMAHAVENRVPFLDRRVVALARRLPSRLLVREAAARVTHPARATKLVLKLLARRFFGDAFVYRQKSGFALPLAEYFASRPFVALMEEQILPSMAQRGLVDAAAVRRRWQAMTGARQEAAESFWITVALELWAQQFLDGRHAG